MKVVDPYEDLEPEFKASLKRYAVMLRKEAAAETDDEKFDVFQSFVTKELRLRSLLYGVELREKAAKEVKKAASLADIQAVLPKSALPAPNASGDVDLNKETTGKVTEPVAMTQPVQPLTTPAQPPAQADLVQNETSKPASVVPAIDPQATSLPRQGDHGTAAVSRNEEAYSPGGRPLMTKLPADGDSEAYSPGGRPITTIPQTIPPAKPSVETSIPKPLPPQPQVALSPSNNAPMVIEDYVTPQPASPSTNAPIVVSSESFPAHSSPRPTQGTNKPVVPIKFEPPRPAYTPFRYNAGVQEEKAKALKPADQAYSSLRNSQVDSGRLLAQDAALLAPVRPTSTSGRKEHEEAFIGLIRKQSMAVRHKTSGPVPPVPNIMRPASAANVSGPVRPDPPPFMRVGTPASARVKTPQPVDTLQDAVTALRSLLPSLDDLPTPIDPSADNPKLKTIKDKIDSVADQFAFIHDTVVEWDRTNRLVRKEQEAERQHRQQESEARIDELFNDNEIGYADIGELEAEFKLSEAEKRYDEDQAELESFTSQVFVVVTERLEKEIAELMTAFTMAIDLLDLESMAVSRCFKPLDGGKKPIRMPEVMSCVLMLFNKIENRHRKLAEAHVERERRRKHLELTVLYTNGDVSGVKTLEKEFAVAEKMAVLHEARAQDNRANKLMDSFDRATVRALGDNQVFIDDLVAKLQELKKAADLALRSPNENQKDDAVLSSAKDALTLAQSTLDTLISDSRRLLALSNEADVLLNDADFNVSIAEARVANADKDTYKKLEDEKAKEDGKLIEEMNSRIGGVTKDPDTARKVIKEVLERIGAGAGGGDGGGGGGSAVMDAGAGVASDGVGAGGGGGGPDDPGHQERLKRALEQAKKRNERAGGAEP